MLVKKIKLGCLIDDNSERARGVGYYLLQKYKMKKFSLYPEITKSEECDVMVIFGGDGFMIRAIHAYMGQNISFYGINCGTLGFLMNNLNLDSDDLFEKIYKSIKSNLSLIKAKMFTVDDMTIVSYAINEVVLLRKTVQTIHVKISINDVCRLDYLIGDGVMLATPGGSAAYNFSAGGPIIPLQSGLFALTPISPFRPRRWRGALLSQNLKITFEVKNSQRRPANFFIDHKLFSDIRAVEMSLGKSFSPVILFDQGHELEGRIINEQFLH